MKRIATLSRQRGLGMVAAIVVLVILAALAGGIVAFGAGQQSASAQDALAARAWQAAKAGNEWGLYKSLRGGWCSAGSQNELLDLTGETGFRVRVCCEREAYKEGVKEDAPDEARELRFYRITAVACNAADCGGCGGVAAVAGGAPAYVERTRVVLAGDNGN